MKKTFNLDDSYGVLIILNENIEILSLDVIIGKARQMFLKKDQSGKTRFPFIDMLLIFSESHTLISSVNSIIFPSCHLPSPKIYQNLPPELIEFTEKLKKDWANYNNVETFKVEKELNQNESLSYRKVDKGNKNDNS